MFRKFNLKALLLTFLCVASLTFVPSAKAIVDPLATPNNKFGIHIISPSSEEVDSAAALVNSNGGDWGYITLLIEDKDRNLSKWQTFFNQLREKHLIPLVRIATHNETDFWTRPDEQEAKDWAEFLDSLIWPTKNRYVIIYNEPNHGKEWGNSVDAAGYAKTLNQTIDAFKAINQNFFVLNAGLDASTPEEKPNYQDSYSYMQEMHQAVPEVFSKLDGWVSHSYPNPGFMGSPDATGKGTIRTWEYELTKLKELGVTKKLPVFITETGWKHSDGVKFNKMYPSPEKVAEYYTKAYQEAWNNDQIVAVTPFLLSYHSEPFDHFSFKRISQPAENKKVLGESYPDFLPPYFAIQELPKEIGQPQRESTTKLAKGTIYNALVSQEKYEIPLTFKNTGQTVWNEDIRVKLLVYANQGFEIKPVMLPLDQKIRPGDEYTFMVQFEAPIEGEYQMTVNLYADEKPFENNELTYTTSVKSPVNLEIRSSLKWKPQTLTDYALVFMTTVGEQTQGIVIKEGKSPLTHGKYLLPGSRTEFTLSKPYYHPKTITIDVVSGTNVLDFGELEPDMMSAMFNPRQMWKLTPFSNPR